jgi:hypothetical protein
MLLFWLFAVLQSPASPAGQLALGLAVVAAALVLVLAVVAVRALPPVAGRGPLAADRRARNHRVTRVADPDAAGRPRPRAPSAFPAAA